MNTELYQRNERLLQQHHKSAYDVIKRQNIIENKMMWLCANASNTTTARSPEGIEIRFSGNYSLSLGVQRDLLIMNGFADGRGVAAALQAFNGDILVYEPCAELFAGILGAIDISAILSDARVSIILGHEESGCRRDLEVFFDSDASRLTKGMSYQLITDPFEEKLPVLSERFANFINAYSQVLSAKADRYKPNEEDSYRGLVNTLKNFPEYYENFRINELQGVHAGKIGVSVSTGPSLKFSLPYLKKYQNELVIFCADSAAKILLREGITPHFIGCLERVMGTRYLLDGLPALPNTYFVVPPVVRPDSIAKYQGPVLRIERDINYDNWFYNTGRVGDNIGSSVSHLNYVGLRILGCNPIYLVGQDSAYDPHTQGSHVAGADSRITSHGSWLRDKSDDCGKMAIDGYAHHKQFTMFYWHQNTIIFDKLITEYGGDVINVIPEEYGIPIPKTRRMDPDEAFTTAKKIRFNHGEQEQLLLSRLKKKELPEIGRDSLIAVRKYLDEYVREVRAIMQKISLFWMDHDISYMPELESHYQQFFAEMEKIQGDLASGENEMFKKILYPLVQNSFIHTGVSLGAILREKDVRKRINGQMNILMQFYSMLYFWSSRSLELIETENRQRWHYW